MKRNALMKVFAVILALGMLVSYIPVDATAKTAVPQQTVTVDNAVLDDINKNGVATYWVDFTNSADLSKAYFMDWSERGWYVYETLKEQAEKTQSAAVAYLEATGVEYQSFWIANRILVKQSNNSVLSGLQQLPNVVSISAQKSYTLYEPEKVSVSDETKGIEPNIAHVLAPEAWDLGFDGAGLVVANIDTGVRYTHQALVGQYRGNNGDGTFNHNYNWLNPVTASDNVPRDGNGHGTHTMGTMVGDDGGSNQIGIAPGAEWMACAGCPDGTCPDAALLGCGEFVTAPTDLAGNNADPDMRPNVVNNSWGDCSTSYDDWYADVVSAWQAAGVYPVFSNGNNSNCGYPAPPGLNTVGNPGRYGNVTGVGSSGTANGQYASHSNWGPTDNLDTINPVVGFAMMKPQVIAPGVSIRSSIPTSDTSYQGGWSGTSMSAPHVTGLVAMIMQAAPCLVGDYSTIETILESTATHITYNDGSPLTPTDYPNFASGWGEINAQAAVQMASGMCGNSVLYGTVTSDSAAPIPGAKVVLTGTDAANNRTVYTNAAGQYTANVNADTFDMAVTAFGFMNGSAEDVVVADSASVLQDFVLTELPNTLVTGVVYDDGIEGGDAHGYPLYAKMTFSMTGFSETVYTDPITGEYEIVLYNSQEYAVKIEALLPGYQVLNTTITADDVAVYEQDYYLYIDNVSCSAPGYSPDYEIMYDFEAGDHGFVASGTNSSWARGIPTNGPGAAHSGSYVIATNPTGNYNANELSYMTSPAIDLTGYGTNAPVIEFWQWRHMESATFDNATVEVSKNGGTTWTAVYGPVGGMTDTAYNKVLIALDSSYNVANFKIRFKFKSDSSVNYEGWYVDDIGIASFPIPAPTQVYFENFDASDGGFVKSGTNSSWAWGAPSATPGPGAPYSSPNVWATNLTGNYNNSEESFITSPAIDLSAYTGKAPILSFMHWYNSESNSYDYPSVEVSKDGGTTWAVLGQKFGTSVSPWTAKTLLMDPSYAVSNFQFRFHFHSDSSVNGYAGWYVDDVRLLVSEPYTIAVPCGTIDGGIVAGYVFDANFPTEKLIGANVGTNTTSALTSANANDPDHAGLYYTFQATSADPEDVEFTVSLAKYETKVETRSIEQDVVNHEDFELGAGMLSALPTSLTRTIWLHDDPEFTTLTLENEGAGGANFKITETDKGFQPYSIPAYTGEAIQNTGTASMLRDPNAATTVGGLELNALSGRYGITAAPPAYGVDIYDNDKVYLWPDVSVPGTSTLIGTSTATSLFAGDFMGGDFSTLYAISYDNNGLYAIDTATAAATFIGTTTPPSGATFSGLAGGPGVMYGMATACNASSTLMTVDIATGTTTTIGTLPNATCIIDIAYVPADGMIYGVDLVTNSLYRIDPATGADTLVGAVGADANYAQGMDYDEVNNVLYWAAYTTGPELRIIDINTGASALIGAFTQGEVDSFAIAAGGGGGAVPWLDESPVEGYVPAFGDGTIQIEFNVDDIEQPGDYFAELKISTDTPYPVPNIPVTLHVVRPFDYGNIKGNITATGKCDEDPAPFKNATINFYKNGSLAFSTGTDENGYYSYALKNGTYDVEVAAEGYVTQMEFGVVVGMSTDTVLNVQLRLNDTCLSIDPTSFYQELAPNGTATQTMTVINTGALEAPFEISERPGAGPVPYSKAFDVELVLDDGTAEDAIGIGGATPFLALNRFTPNPDQFPFFLEQVDISFEASGNVAAGDPLTIVVYSNPTGNTDPAVGSVLLYQQDVVVGNATTWNNYVLDEPVLLEGPGDVLIGAIYRKTPGSAYFPASIDLNASQQRSWAGWWSGDIPAEPTLPPDAEWTQMDAAGFAGNWTMRGMGSAGSTDIIWLTEDPTAGVVEADGGTLDVTLAFDATALTWGDYFGSLRIASPTEATLNIPVQLRILALPENGFIQGNVYELEICNVNPAPAAKVGVQFFQNGSLMFTIQTDETGFYRSSILSGTYDLVVEIDGYETQTFEGVVVTAGGTTTQDFTLRLLAPCVKASPTSLEKWLLPDTTGTQILKLTNIGAAEAVFEMMELPSLKSGTPGPTYEYHPELDVAGLDKSKVAPQSMIQALPYNAPKDVLVGEGFEGVFPPTDWELQSLSPWTWERDDYNPHSGSFNAQVLYDENMDDQDEWLVTPEFNLSEGTLSFWSFGSLTWCRDTYDNCDLNVWLVIGDIGGGDDIFLMTADEDWAVTWEWAQSTIDLAPYLPGGMVRIGFQYAGADGAQIGLDDIVLDGLEGGDIEWLSEDPTAGVIPAGESTEITITYDATGLVVGDYLATLRIKNAPAPNLNLPVKLHVVDELPVYYYYLPMLLR